MEDCAALKIGYRTPGGMRYLEIPKHEVESILSSFRVAETDEGAISHKAALCTVDFVTKNGSTIRAKFIAPSQLERIDWGQLYLVDDRFYQKISDAISRAEGKPVDPLGDFGKR